MTDQNQNKTNRVITSIAITIVALNISSCKINRTSQRIIVASAGKINSLDPAQANTFHALQLLSSLGDTLYKLNNEGNLTPQLATELPLIKDNGKTIYIPLREGVLFHDEKIFDANAMVFSINRFSKIGTLSYVLGDRINSVDAPEKYLLRIRLNRPSSSLKGLLTSINLTPISPASYVNHKDKFLNNKFIGTGPYKLISFSTQKQRLEPFSLYWNKQPRNVGIDFINLSNSTALFGAMRSGEIDVLLSNSIDEDQRKALNNIAKSGLIKEGSGPAMEIGYITFRSNSPPLNNVITRKALLHSLDRNLISQRVSYKLRDPLRSLIPPSLKLEKDKPWPKYNPTIAKELFAEAGFCKKKKLYLPLTFRANVPSDKLLALIWQAQLKRDFSSCIELKLNGIESTTIYRQLSKGAYEAVILDWRGAYPDPEAYLSPLLSCTKSQGAVCEEGEAVASGSFWTAPIIQKALKNSDIKTGEFRKKQLNLVENEAAKGAAYLPVWIVKPRAWSQANISKPEFDGTGQILLQNLVIIKK